MKAVIYSRVSSDGQSTQRQILELEEYAAKQNYQIVGIYEDIITGASKAADRIGFESMLSLLAENQDVKLILCWELSRFGRSMIDVYTNINKLKERNINIYFLKENIETLSTSATSQLQINLLASFAEFERSTIRERTRSGQINAVKKGGAGGSVIKAYGYMPHNKQLVVNEDEANNVKRIFESYVNGLSCRQIAILFNREQIPTKYATLIDNGVLSASPTLYGWRNALINKILRNKIYIGIRKYGEVEYFDEKLQIIENELFDKVQNKLDTSRKIYPNAKKYEQIFKGKLYCGVCGSFLMMKKGHNPNSYNHYYCASLDSESIVRCKNRMIKIDILNNSLYHMLNRYQINDNAIKDRITQNNNELRSLGIQCDDLKNELTKTAAKKNKLLDLYLNENIDKQTYTSRLKIIEVNENDFETKMIDYQNTINQLIIINKQLQTKEIVDLQSPELFKKHINSLIERIEIKEIEDYSKYNFKPNAQNYLMQIDIQMIDVNAKFQTIISNKQDVPIVVRID